MVTFVDVWNYLKCCNMMPATWQHLGRGRDERPASVVKQHTQASNKWGLAYFDIIPLAPNSLDHLPDYTKPLPHQDTRKAGTVIYHKGHGTTQPDIDVITHSLDILECVHYMWWSQLDPHQGLLYWICMISKIILLFHGQCPSCCL